LPSPSEKVPDIVPDDGVQPPPQLPPHVSVTESSPVEYLPTEQSRHVVLDPAPTVVEYVPAPQLVQLVLPAAEYFPAEHSTHARLDTAPVVVE
jgi:hypothetical protein